jgi:(1->4)-alpha-D-glucan 1-alpha-D-glucosylmutase
LRTGVLDGVRVDHIDGLRDPSAYLERLTLAAPGAWLIVEKILETDEHLPDWPVAGTTGYDFARRATGVLIDTTAEQQFTDFYADLTGDTQTFEVLARAAKREVLEKVLAADLARLTHQFFMLCQHHRRHRDYSRHELGAALAETLVASPVYRTYVRRRRDGSTQLTSTDRAVIDRTLAEVTATTGLDAELLEFLGRILRLELDDPAAVELCVSFQQLSAPVMAKGVEDTAFYRHSRFVALNEVGADPGVFGVSLDDFHRENQHIATRWPATMLTTSTHDTKRSEDVRARLAVLTEVPDQWFETVERWAARNERYRHGSWPDRVTEYLLYQTLVGAHPITADRVHTYIEKAVREAKVHTSWLSPNIDYEKATAAFVDAILDDRSFRAELDAFVSTVWDAGWTNALTQVLLKLTAPGVPDLYQGSEVWDLSLVDPDNRRPVDFAARRTLLAEVAELDAEAVMRRTDAGGPKLWLIQRALRVRKAVPDAFAGGAATYEPVFATGQDRDRVIAYVRGDRVMTVAQRFTLCRGDQWGDTQLAIPPGRWHDALGGARYEGGPIAADRLFRAFPAALLMRSE